MNIFRRLRSLFRRRKLDADMAEEMRLHLELEAERHRAAGLSDDEARYAAQREFGNIGVTQQQAREGRAFVYAEQFLHDWPRSLGQLRRAPLFTIVSVLVLAVAIAATTTVFSVADALLFRPLPVRDPGGLEALTWVRPFQGQDMLFDNRVPLPFVRAFEEQNTGFSFLFGTGWENAPAAVQGSESERVFIHVVTGDYFPALGLKPVCGRLLDRSDDKEAQSLVAVLSFDYWQRTCHGDQAVVGRTLTINQQPLTVVGVAPRGFYGFDQFQRAQIWIPAVAEKAVGIQTSFDLIGRRAPGITSDQAVVGLQRTCRYLVEVYGQRGAPGYEKQGSLAPDMRPTLQPAARGMVGAGRSRRAPNSRVAELLGLSVGLVLAVACANVMSLYLMRGIARRREIAVKLAIGAGRGRVLRQLVTESVVISLSASALGALIAHGAIAGMAALGAGGLNWQGMHAAIDARALVFTSVVAVIAGVGAGLLPALQTLRVDLNTALKQGAPSVSGRFHRNRFARLLVVLQTTLCVTLLAAAGFSLRSFLQLLSVDLGFSPKSILAASGYLDWEKFPPSVALGILSEASDRVSALPGVRAVALTDNGTIYGNVQYSGLADRVEGYEPKRGEQMSFLEGAAGPGLFRFLKVPVLAGREFTAHDSGSAPVVIVVNQSFARRFWPGQNPLGKRVDGAEVVGVVGDVRASAVWSEPEPRCYHSILQRWNGSFMILAASDTDPALLVSAVRKSLETSSAALTNADVDSLDRKVAATLSSTRFFTLLLQLFAGTAVLLASVGLYGFLSCAVALRTREMGIRAALGASHADILAMVMRQGFALVATGLVAGIALWLYCARFARSYIYGLSLHEAPTLAVVAILFTAIACLAMLLPARRAAKVDPVVVLRAE